MKRILLISLVMVLVPGCLIYRPQPLVPADAAARLETRTLDDPELLDFVHRHLSQAVPEWPLSRWGLDDLTLAAIYFHPDLAVARAQWAVAQAGMVTAGERPNPVIGIAPAYNATTAVPSPWIITATFDVPIETAGKRGFRVARATELSEAARMNIAAVAWQIRSRVRRSLADLHAAGEREALLEQQQAIHAENVRLLELQYKAGEISAFELTQARLAADNAQLALGEAARHSAEARVQMASAAGVPVHALDDVAFSFEGLRDIPAEINREEVHRQALLNRADILGALAEYAASQSALQLEIAKQYPDVHLGPGYEYDQGNNKWSLGLSVTLPIFSRNRGAIAEAEALRDEAAARFHAVQARVLEEIESAAAGFAVARQRQAATDAMLVNLTKQEMTAQAMFAAGEISMSELAGLRLQLIAAALARLEAQVQLEQAAGQLEDALQSPLMLSASAWQAASVNSEPDQTEDRP